MLEKSPAKLPLSAAEQFRGNNQNVEVLGEDLTHAEIASRKYFL